MIVPKMTKKVQVICPICKSRDIVGIPEIKRNLNSQLTTISIHKGLICPHHFQVFMDRDFQIRGYQKVDLELEQRNIKNLRNGVAAFNPAEEEDKELFENIILEGNSLKYCPLNYDDRVIKTSQKAEIGPRKKEMTLKEIYEEFWEFIDEDNEEFQKFIIIDKRRIKSSGNCEYIENYNYLNLAS
ncbi:MAG: hypothetical protein ACFE8L_03375 [Candidatus Hodarchaeota archaeon]